MLKFFEEQRAILQARMGCKFPSPTSHKQLKNVLLNR